jgi:hypothetical protein
MPRIMEEDYIKGGICVQMVWRVYLALYLGLELTMHVLKSQIHLVRQFL